jgi:hypothetical protein
MHGGSEKVRQWALPAGEFGVWRLHTGEGETSTKFDNMSEKHSDFNDCPLTSVWQVSYL